jgi:O-antigen/teichoic acid export membrane protein
VLVPLTIPLVQNVGIAILQAKNKHQFRSLAYLVCALLNVVISIVLVPAVGITGAAWGTAIGLTLGNIIVINIYYHRVIGLEIPRFFIELSQGILPILLLMLAVGAGINRLWGANSWLNLLARITAFTLLYAVGMWTVGMNTYEKRLILPEGVHAAFRRAD